MQVATGFAGYDEVLHGCGVMWGLGVACAQVVEQGVVGYVDGYGGDGYVVVFECPCVGVGGFGFEAYACAYEPVVAGVVVWVLACHEFVCP